MNATTNTKVETRARTVNCRLLQQQTSRAINKTPNVTGRKMSVPQYAEFLQLKNGE